MSPLPSNSPFRFHIQTLSVTLQQTLLLDLRVIDREHSSHVMDRQV